MYESLLNATVVADTLCKIRSQGSLLLQNARGQALRSARRSLACGSRSDIAELRDM